MLPQTSVVKILLHVSLPLRRPAFSSTLYFMHWFLFDSFYPLGYIRSFSHEYWTDLEQTSFSRTWQMVWACFLIRSCLEFMLLRGKVCIQHVRHCHLAWLPSSCLTTHSEEAFVSFLHRSASNQIQGCFFSQTSLQSIILFPSRCSPEVLLMTPQDQGDGYKWTPLLPSHLGNGRTPVLPPTQLGSPATLPMNFCFCSLSLDHFCDPGFLVLPRYRASFFSPSPSSC